MHGLSPVKLVKREIKNNGVEKLVCLGDYDTPEVLRDIRRLKLPKVLIVGNHDFHYVHNLGIRSENMHGSWEEYVKLWIKNPTEKSFIERAIKGNSIKRRNTCSGLVVEDIFDRLKVSYSHASIVDGGSPVSEAPGYVWARFRDSLNILQNFVRMNERNIGIMFRGHDHISYSGGVPINGLTEARNINDLFSMARAVVLDKNKRYIISVGAFIDAEYALFDTNSMRLEFKFGIS